MTKRFRSNISMVKIGDSVVQATTISGLGKIVGKSRNTLLRYERNGVLPPAPLTIGNYRYYPVSLAEKLKPLIESLPLNTKPSAEVLVQIKQLFKEEIDKYAN